MNQNFNTINLECVEANKVSIWFKIIAFILTLFLVFIPMYELIAYALPSNIYQCTYGIVGTCGCIIP
ncbi:MAG: hypothetical protein ED556_10425 [Winogradskyella sp.]|nr:MAG: hypothetical protein ED556_10425 [Winogradskyella sp.]